MVDKEGIPRILTAVVDSGPIVRFRPKVRPPRILIGLGSEMGESSEPFLSYRSEAGVPVLKMGLGPDIGDDPVQVP